MVRLLQGDVGSGKTVVAALAMLVAIANGCQAAIMVPTEILARQHYQTVIRLIAGIARHQGADSLTVERLNAIIRDVDNDTLPDVVVIPDVPLGAGRVRPVCVARLVGSLNDSTKHVLHQRIAEGEVDIAIGTHALIQEAVSFARLGLAIVDEQHRFGVLQRAALRSKGKGEGTSPHVLVMTATPIPRTLALTLYGDLDISVLDQMPPGRLPVKTKVLDPSEKERAYTFIRRQVEQGHQAFVICPLIEESEALDEVRAATEEYERLQREVFPDLKVGLLHGRMKQVEKDEVMDRFRRNEINVLVSTAVVEVGIDVPNATVILIEGAERFGLAQLHQFRGRVRRSQAPSYCILLPTRKGEAVEERLQPMESINDGLALADLDLQQRGMGELLGTLQSGHEVTLKMARLSDVGILERARAAAQAILQEDPMLARPEHRLLAQQVAAFWHIEEEGSGDIS
jgi:ATP-dependent DNA helicase RecG